MRPTTAYRHSSASADDYAVSFCVSAQTVMGPPSRETRNPEAALRMDTNAMGVSNESRGAAARFHAVVLPLPSACDSFQLAVGLGVGFGSCPGACHVQLMNN